MSARLPIVGGDNGDWGAILNQFLDVAHNTDGSLQTGAIKSAGAVTSVNGTAPSNGDVTVALSGLADTNGASSATEGQVLSYDSTTSSWVAAQPTVAWPLKAMIPMYIYPTYLGSFWNVIEANPTNVEYVIVNVNSGPGSAVNSDYTLHIGNMRAVGVKVIGYIDTNYGSVSQASVESQMNTWTNFYALDGFFLDRAQSVAGTESYYQTLNTYAKNMNSSFITVNNYGTVFAQSYMPTADIHIMTENTEANLLAGVPSLTDYEFIYQYPITRFAETIYAATAANLQADMAAVTQRHSGYVFITPDDLYGSEPPFWAQEQTWLGGFGEELGVTLGGTPSAGQLLTATSSSTASWQAPYIAPAAFSLAMWTLPMFQASATAGVGAQTLVAVLACAASTTTLTKLGVWVTVVGSGPGSGVNGLALYSEAGTKLAVTSDMTSKFESTGYVEGTLTASYTITAGTNYYLVYLHNFSTAPTLAVDGAAGAYPVIRGHYPSVVAFAQTSFPASFTPSSMSAGDIPIFLTAGS